MYLHGFDELDDQQLYMLDSVASGMSVSNISREQGINVSACYRRIARLYRALGLDSAEEMIAKYNAWLEGGETDGDHRKTA